MIAKALHIEFGFGTHDLGEIEMSVSVALKSSSGMAVGGDPQLDNNVVIPTTSMVSEMSE